MDLEMKGVGNLETLLRREGLTNMGCLAWKGLRRPCESHFQISEGISHLVLLQVGRGVWWNQGSMVRKFAEIKLGYSRY
jgi:hypothetical protein